MAPGVDTASAGVMPPQTKRLWWLIAAQVAVTAVVARLLLASWPLFSRWDVADHEHKDALYAVIIDAGSTGSRAHIFRWYFDPGACNSNGAVRVVLPEKNAKIRPGVTAVLEKGGGLSDAVAVGQNTQLVHYLNQVREAVDSHVPIAWRQKTPIWFFGTAGMRPLPGDTVEALLKAISSQIASWGYWFEDSWASILGGELEGLYLWTIANQLLERIPISYKPDGSNDSGDAKPQRRRRFLSLGGSTAAVVELGGASVQVVAEPPRHFVTDKLPPAVVQQLQSAGRLPNDEQNNTRTVMAVPDADGFVIVDFCGEKTVLFSKSFQGYGRQLALQRYLQRPELVPLTPPAAETTISVVSKLPCLPSDVHFPLTTEESVMLATENIGVREISASVAAAKGSDTKVSPSNTYFVTGEHTGSFETCEAAVAKTLFPWLPSHSNGLSGGSSGSTDAIAPVALEDNIDDEIIGIKSVQRLPFILPEGTDVVATENFYHFHTLVNFPDSLAPNFTLNELVPRAGALCAESKHQRVAAMLGADAEPEKADTGCFGLTYIIELLRSVVRVDIDRPLHAINQIKSVDLAWPAGHLVLELPLILQRKGITSSDQLRP